MVDINGVIQNSHKLLLRLISAPGTIQETNQESDKVEQGSERVLVVEDSPEVRLFTEKVLKYFGYECYTVESGEKALEMAVESSFEPHLLITDMVMPGMNGRELATSMYEIYPHLKVIFTSGYTDDHIVYEGFLKEGINFLQKPYSVSQIAKMVRSFPDEN